VAKHIGQGSTLSVEKTTGVYTKLGQITEWSLSSSVGSIETTDLDSLRKEYRPGIPDSGELSVTAQYDPANVDQEFVRGLTDDPEVVGWKVAFPTTPPVEFTFSGFVMDSEVGAGGPEEVVELSLTIKITGAIAKTTAED
jgi:hypothetical protein